MVWINQAVKLIDASIGIDMSIFSRCLFVEVCRIVCSEQRVGQPKGTIRNPAGFYVSLIRENVVVPDTFETSCRRKEREAASEAYRAQQQGNQRLLDAYRTYQACEVKQYLASLAPEALEALVAAARAELFDEHKNLRHLMGAEQVNRLARDKVASQTAKQRPAANLRRLLPTAERLGSRLP